MSSSPGVGVRSFDKPPGHTESGRQLHVPCMVAIGIILALGATFLTLAAHQILPHGVNAISKLGLGGQLLGYTGLGLGVLTTLIGTMKWCLGKNSRIPNAVEGSDEISTSTNETGGIGKKITITPSDPEFNSSYKDEGVTEITLDLRGFRGVDMLGNCDIPQQILQHSSPEDQKKIKNLQVYELQKSSFNNLLATYPNVNTLIIQYDPFVLRLIEMPDIEIIYREFCSGTVGSSDRKTNDLRIHKRKETGRS